MRQYATTAAKKSRKITSAKTSLAFDAYPANRLQKIAAQQCDSAKTLLRPPRYNGVQGIAIGRFPRQPPTAQSPRSRRAKRHTVSATWQLCAFFANSNGVDVRLYKTGIATALSGAVLGGGGHGSSNPDTFTANTSTGLLAGESLDFVVNRFGDSNSDVTAVSGTVSRVATAVPESGTFALALPCVALLGGLVVRRARKTA